MVPQGPTPGNQALQHSSSFADGTALTAAPAVADALAELLRSEVAAWPQLGLTEHKRRTVRRVFSGRLGGVDAYVKVFRADTIAAKARRLLRRLHKGEREARNLQAARDARLPAVEPLAYGLARDGKELCSFIVTRGVAATPFTLPCEAPLAVSAGALIRRVHDAGLLPGDLHPGNLLVGDDGKPWLCDLTALRRAGDLSLRERAAALAFFCNPADGGPLDPVAKALLRGYAAAGALPDGFRHELARAARQLRATSLRSFGRRSTRSCKHTEAEPRRRATPRWFWFVEDGQDGEQLRAEAAAFDPDLHPPRRTGRRGSVWLCDTVAVKQRDAGKARKLWLAHYWLLFARVPTAPPVALQIDAGQGRVFVRRLPGLDIAAELRADALGSAAVARAARAVGRSVGRLHGHGLRNRDLKLDNLVRVPEDGEVAMVDLDGVTLHSAEDSRGCGRDLGRLLAAWQDAGSPGGPETASRFLRAYVRARRRLLQRPPIARIVSHALRRANEWRRSHG